MVKLAFASILLNEEEFIEKNIIQHYNWVNAEVKQWLIIEGADYNFPKTNVSASGLSTDRTAEIINSINDYDNKIKFIQKGFASKLDLRREYLKYIDDDIDYLITIDADEGYPYSQQKMISNYLEITNKYSILTNIHNLWKTDKQEIIGKYWGVPHLKIFKWQKGNYYRTHIQMMNKKFNYNIRSDKMTSIDAYMVHYGYFRQEINCREKIEYYENRGELKTRPMYCMCRNAFFTNEIPQGCEVINYKYELPEAFR